MEGIHCRAEGQITLKRISRSQSLRSTWCGQVHSGPARGIGRAILNSECGSPMEHDMLSQTSTV